MCDSAALACPLMAIVRAPAPAVRRKLRLLKSMAFNDAKGSGPTRSHTFPSRRRFLSSSQLACHANEGGSRAHSGARSEGSAATDAIPTEIRYGSPRRFGGTMVLAGGHVCGGNRSSVLRGGRPRNDPEIRRMLVRKGCQTVEERHERIATIASAR